MTRTRAIRYLQRRRNWLEQRTEDQERDSAPLHWNRAEMAAIDLAIESLQGDK
jgi:hypothetical protein